MIVSQHKNEANNTQTELHQISANAFEVKRYYTQLNGVDLVLRNSYYYDNIEKAEGMFNAIK